MKKRHQQCTELLPIIAEVLKLQRARAKVLADRMSRLQERLEAVEQARIEEMEAHAKALEQESRTTSPVSSPDASPRARAQVTATRVHPPPIRLRSFVLTEWLRFVGSRIRRSKATPLPVG